jgi:hypothetical protein
MIYFLLSSGWWRLLKIFLLLHLSHEDLDIYWDTLSWLHLPRNLHVDFDPWHNSILVSNPSKFEWASKLVRKVFTSSHCCLPWYHLNAESTLMAWFWRIFTHLFSQWRSSTWVFGLQVKIIGWSSRVRLGFDTSMLIVSWFVRRFASVGVLREYHPC